MLDIVGLWVYILISLKIGHQSQTGLALVIQFRERIILGRQNKELSDFLH